jgi:hypothetical protein
MANEERSHYRYVSTLSYWARRVPGVRHLDLDLYQYCPRCKQPEAFCEVKPTTACGMVTDSRSVGPVLR